MDHTKTLPRSDHIIAVQNVTITLKVSVGLFQLKEEKLGLLGLGGRHMRRVRDSQLAPESEACKKTNRMP